jgi:hypothetical protein
MLQVLGHLLSCPAVDPAIPAVSDVFSTVKTRLTSAKRTDSLVALTVLKTMLKRRGERSEAPRRRSRCPLTAELALCAPAAAGAAAVF